MKKSILYLSVIMLSTAVVLSSCKKDNSQANTTDNTAQISTQVDDQSRVSEETDAVSNDVVASVESSSVSISGREMDIQSLICDATVTMDTASNPKTITITYNGANCSGSRTRTGVVTISIPADVRWKNAGAVLTVSYKNLKITRALDNKSIILNGTHTITNVSGGLMYNLVALPSITHTITSSDMSVTFDDGSKRTWSVARQRVFAYHNGIVVTETGTHTDGANTGIEEWGTTRFGNPFTNAITEPLVVRQDCSFRLVSGTFKHTSILATTTVVFGLDATGNPTSCPAAGSSYYFKATWTGIGGKSATVILPY